MLSPLQRRLRRIIDTIPEAADVALAGGGALIVRGVVARPTADLDYFATSSRDVDRLLPALEARLEGEGLCTRRVQDHPGFARLSVSDGHDTARIDLAWDTRLWPPEKTAGGVLLSEQELGADKLLALADRGEACSQESGPTSKPRHPSPLEIGAQLDRTGPNGRRLSLAWTRGCDQG